MTREEFDNFSIDDFTNLSEKIKQKNILTEEIKGLKEYLEPINKSLEELNKKIDNELEVFNNTSNLSNLENLRELKEEQIVLNNQINYLKSEIEKKENELFSLEKTKDNKRRIIFSKANANKIVNKLKIDKDGLKLSKASVKKYKDRLKDINIIRKASDVFDKVKENIPSKKDVKDFVVNDLKKGVVYGTYQKVNERAPEIKKAAKLKIDKSKSAIAKVKKGAVNSIINTFNKVSTYVSDKKKAVVTKKDRFINTINARKEAKEELNKKMKDLIEEKRKQLEEFKQTKNQYYDEYNNKVKTAFSL